MAHLILTVDQCLKAVALFDRNLSEHLTSEDPLVANSANQTTKHRLSQRRTRRSLREKVRMPTDYAQCKFKIRKCSSVAVRTDWRCDWPVYANGKWSELKTGSSSERRVYIFSISNIKHHFEFGGSSKNFGCQLDDRQTLAPLIAGFIVKERRCKHSNRFGWIGSVRKIGVTGEF